jgi:apolipoprotein N-acyltransferase
LTQRSSPDFRAAIRQAVPEIGGVRFGYFPAAIVTAALLVVSMPGLGWGLAAWVALVPLLAAVRKSTPQGAFILGYLTGLGYFFGTFYWVKVVDEVRWLDYLLLGLYLACYVGLFALVTNLLCRGRNLPLTLVAPPVWILAEFAWSHVGFLALPMALLGYTQYEHLSVIQFASLAGVYGVSYLVVLANSAFAEMVLDYGAWRRIALPASLLVVTIAGYGLWQLQPRPVDGGVGLTVIQGNIRQDLKWKPELQQRHLQKHLKLTREAVKATRTGLVVWPEGSVQGYLTRDSSLYKRITELAKETGKFLLLGSSQRPKFGNREFRLSHLHNTAYLISPTGKIIAAYQKMRLLPFAEYLPLQKTFPWPSRLSAGADNFVPGREYTIFSVGKRRMGAMICWESGFSEIARGLRTRGAEFVVNIGNEAWFGKTKASYHFLAQNVFRAVENRLAIARAVNTGVSGFIDPFGRILSTVRHGDQELFVEGFRAENLPLSAENTFYSRYGDLFAYFNIMLVVLLTAIVVLPTKKMNSLAEVIHVIK